MYRYQVYEKLVERRREFLDSLEKEVAPGLGLLQEWRGEIGLTGSNSARPAYLRSDIIAALTQAARSKRSLSTYLEEIRAIIKAVYGDEYDAVPIATCEAALWTCLHVLASPPIAGRGSCYRCQYIGLYESNIQHHLSYGRPFPPRYKDIFADRTNTAGELGMIGRRLSDLDVIIVPVDGAKYVIHGVKPFPVPLLMEADAKNTAEAVFKTISRHVDTVTAICSLGYETPGFGYGTRQDGERPDMNVGLSKVAREFDIPYIVDKARALPVIGEAGATRYGDVVLFSMDKVAGATTSGLIVGREEYLVHIRRALGFHSDRFGSGAIPYGKGAFTAFDPGREAIVSQVAALRWLMLNEKRVYATVDSLYEIVSEQFKGLCTRFPSGIYISKTYRGFGVEVNYSKTWETGEIGIPIFNNEDEAADTNFIVLGLRTLGILPPACAEGNIFITPNRGMLDDQGELIVERARKAVAALVSVIEKMLLALH